MIRIRLQPLAWPLLVLLWTGLLALHLRAQPGSGPPLARDSIPADAFYGPEMSDDLAALRIELPTDEGSALVFHNLIVTGYTSCPRETDSTPYITASMTRVRPGCLALSRDLLRTFTEGAPFDFGDWVVLPGVGIFIVEDTMNARWRQRADIWFQHKRQARHWGRRRAMIAHLPMPLEDGSALFALGLQSGDRP